MIQFRYSSPLHGMAPRARAQFRLPSFVSKSRQVRNKITKRLHRKFVRRIGSIRQKAVTSYDNITCAICAMVYKDAFLLEPCKHSFCNGCITAWMQRKPSCPMCRASTILFRRNSSLQNKTDSLCESISVESKRESMGIDRTVDTSQSLLKDCMSVNKFLTLVPDSVAASTRENGNENFFEEEIARIEVRLQQLRTEQEEVLRQRRGNILRVHRQFETDLDRLDREEELLNIELEFYYNR